METKDEPSEGATGAAAVAVLPVPVPASSGVSPGEAVSRNPESTNNATNGMEMKAPGTALSSGRALPVLGIANPVYSPFPSEPPPAYGPQTANFQAPGHSSAVSAAAGTHQAISLNGRSSVAVVCPFCCNSVLTATTESPSPVFGGNKRAYYSFGGSILFILLLFGIMVFMAGTTITMFVMPGFIIFLLFTTIWVSRQRRRVASQLYADITHTCPLCKKTLGVSSGFQFLQMIQSNSQRY